MAEGLRASAAETVYLGGIRSSSPPLKKREKTDTSGRCPRCGVFVAEDYFVCPYCANQLKRECPKCKRPIPLNWKACSYCGNILVPVNLPHEDIPSAGRRPLRIQVSGEVPRMPPIDTG